MSAPGNPAARRHGSEWRRALLALLLVAACVVLQSAQGLAEAAGGATAGIERGPGHPFRMTLPDAEQLTAHSSGAYESSTPCRVRERAEGRARDFARASGFLAVGERALPAPALLEAAEGGLSALVGSRTAPSARAPPARSTS